MNKIIRSKPFYKGVSLTLESTQKKSTRLKYEPGAKVEADGFNDDPTIACGAGINFCSSVAAALRWGPRVVEIHVAASIPIVDTGDKLRAAKVTVGAEVSLVRANLEGANLESANLGGANLVGANLVGAHLWCANLWRANLEGANLESAYLEGANLEGANLEGAYLEGAYLGGADRPLPNTRGQWRVVNEYAKRT